MSGLAAQVILYTREGCHLCDEAREGLFEMLAAGAGFELHEVDIESDDSLHRRLLERIPVVEVNGALVCELIFDPDAVAARLATFEA
ncbi:MAG TPA: glutaredoxin family protein [Solirubrobacterales bacterium]|nr:glutaredoxin family protein [Solirubrobacterales bacterium]